MREFRDDDAGYVNWLDAHPDGYVINISRSHRPTGSRMHRAGCRWIRSTGQPRQQTRTYVKICAERVDELEQWAIDKMLEPIQGCQCLRAGEIVRRSPMSRIAHAHRLPMLEGRYDIHFQESDGAVVEAWADDYIRFERKHRPPWQEQLRNDIRQRCRQLKPTDGQLLHATFFGDKLSNADVENLVLYYIDDSFKVPGANGIRFEYGGQDSPPSPSGTAYRFCYRYVLSPRSEGFDHWQQGPLLATFDWIDLGDFPEAKRLAQIWLALARARSRGEVTVYKSAAPGTPFALRVQVRPPRSVQPVWGRFVKPLFDGVICAFQAHTDVSILPDLIARLVKYLPAEPVELKTHLLDQRWAVLGTVPRLLYTYRNDVKWDPADNNCLAGDLLAEPAGPGWAIKGELIELSRRPSGPGRALAKPTIW